VSVARIRGEIDLSNADGIYSTLTRGDSRALRGLIVDLSDVDYLDSAGVRLLFRLARAMGETEQVLRTVVPGDAAIRRVLELANAEDHIGVDESEDTAFANVRSWSG
jgi:anti-anti-sigma factor